MSKVMQWIQIYIIDTLHTQIYMVNYGLHLEEICELYSLYRLAEKYSFEMPNENKPS